MKIHSAILLLLLLLLTGCGPKTMADTAGEQAIIAAERVSLADVDFTTVPGFIFQVLLEEKMGPEQKQFIRCYVQYNGVTSKVTEVCQKVNLPTAQLNVGAAKAWLQENSPDELQLYPQTYLSDSVQAQWEEANYDRRLEAGALISLDELKRWGAITRLNEMFMIKEKPADLAAIIETVEEEFLPAAPEFLQERELEALPRSFTYRLRLQQCSGSNQYPAEILSTATIDLLYRLDELGNPLELDLAFSWQDQGGQAKPAARQTAAFMLEMRRTLIEKLGLYGVTAANPTLNYANVTLSYAAEQTKQQLSERIFLP